MALLIKVSCPLKVSTLSSLHHRHTHSRRLYHFWDEELRIATRSLEKENLTSSGHAYDSCAFLREHEAEVCHQCPLNRWRGE